MEAWARESTGEGRWGGDTGPNMTDQGQQNEIQRGRGTRGCPQDTSGSSEDFGFSSPKSNSTLGEQSQVPLLGELEGAAFQ